MNNHTNKSLMPQHRPGTGTGQDSGRDTDRTGQDKGNKTDGSLKQNSKLKEIFVIIIIICVFVRPPLTYYPCNVHTPSFSYLLLLFIILLCSYI